MTDAYDTGLPRGLVRNTAELAELLKEKYPTLNWDKMGIMQGKYGLQRRLEQAVASLFPVGISLPCS